MIFLFSPSLLNFLLFEFDISLQKKVANIYQYIRHIYSSSRLQGLPADRLEGRGLAKVFLS
jgi:hypothetical protein